MIKIYHNPRCSKSREALKVLKESGKEFEIIKYLDTPLTKTELSKIIKQLNIKPIDLVRTNEAIWKSDFKGKDLQDTDIVEAMTNHPKLIQRPIVISDKFAIIARPIDELSSLV